MKIERKEEELNSVSRFSSPQFLQIKRKNSKKLEQSHFFFFPLLLFLEEEETNQTLSLAPFVDYSFFGKWVGADEGTNIITFSLPLFCFWKRKPGEKREEKHLFLFPLLSISNRKKEENQSPFLAPLLSKFPNKKEKQDETKIEISTLFSLRAFFIFSS